MYVVKVKHETTRDSLAIGTYGLLEPNQNLLYVGDGKMYRVGVGDYKPCSPEFIQANQKAIKKIAWGMAWHGTLALLRIKNMRVEE